MLRKMLAILAVSTLILAVSPTAANALSGKFQNFGRSGAGIHTCTSNTCTALSIIEPGASVDDYCYRLGQNLGGSGAWDIVFYSGGSVGGWSGAAGWTNENWLASNAQSLHCDSSAATYRPNSADRAGSGIHTCRATNCQVLGIVPVGSAVVDLCYRIGQNLNGQSLWHLVYYRNGSVGGYNGVVGWTNVAYLSDEASTVPCP